MKQSSEFRKDNKKKVQKILKTLKEKHQKLGCLYITPVSKSYIEWHKMKIENKRLKLKVKTLQNEQRQVFIYKKQNSFDKQLKQMTKMSIVGIGKGTAIKPSSETKNFQKLKKANERAKKKIETLQRIEKRWNKNVNTY